MTAQATLPAAKVVDQVFKDYKKRNRQGRFCGHDRELYRPGYSPLLDVLIVDEAQDLVPLQWRDGA